MQNALLLALVFLAILPGCPSNSPEPFLKQVNVDVLKPAPDQPELSASLAENSLTVGDDLAVSVLLNLPEKELKASKVGFALFRADGDKAACSANLSQLRAGLLRVIFSTASLTPGDYRLDVTVIRLSPPMEKASLTPVRPPNHLVPISLPFALAARQ